MERKKQEALRA
jgi:hypothetical protein